MSNWIPTDKALPDSNETVIVHSADCDPPVWLGYIEDGEWWHIDGWPAPVTHWMPMPEPPEGAA